jgi:hypothetical protein
LVRLLIAILIALLALVIVSHGLVVEAGLLTEGYLLLLVLIRSLPLSCVSKTSGCAFLGSLSITCFEFVPELVSLAFFGFDIEGLFLSCSFVLVLGWK